LEFIINSARKNIVILDFGAGVAMTLYTFGRVFTMKQAASLEEPRGFLTPEEGMVMRMIAKKPSSIYRHKNVEKWHCKACNSAFFYSIRRCPGCESDNVSPKIHQTLFNPF